jgi:predicted nucleotidyltransferase
LQAVFPAQDQQSIDALHDGLEKIFKISEYLNFPFTLDEVADYFLPRTNITGEQLRQMLSERNFEDIPFHIRDGYLFTKAREVDVPRLERERMSIAKLASAEDFARVLKRLVPFIRTIAVTGSVAYGSADKWDDIDLFVVTKRNRLWLATFLGLAFVRLTKLLGLRPPHLSLFCLSYVHDEQGFANESQSNRTNPLFARELLKAKPVAGVGYYLRLLERNKWVWTLYSTPYAAKLRDLKTASERPSVDRDRGLFSFVLDWIEGIMFPFLSNYLRMRAYLTNLKLKSQGKSLRVFEPRMSTTSCVYTSNFYEWLLDLWGK